MDPVSLQLGTTNLWGWLVRLLSEDPEWLSDKVKFFLPNEDPSSGTEALDPAQRVILQLKKLHAQGLDTWKEFIHCVCMEQNVPLDLEVRLLSIWGDGDGLKHPHQSCESSPPRKQLKKQHRELVQTYLQQLRTSAQRRYGGGLPEPGRPLSFHQAYVPPILQRSRATAPLDTQEEILTGDPRAEDDTDVSIRDLFNTRAKKGPRVTVLLGKAGMGKSTLAQRLCRKWADGQLDHFQALFLFEFRQLNLVEGALTLPQLLFDLSLNPEAGADVVFQYLKENAGRVLLIFDGLEEALHPCSGGDTPGSAFALFSDLCRGTLLPGCWVLVTSRPGKLPACLPTEAATFHMWGFDTLRVQEYVGRFFGDQPWREAALAELRADRHLQILCAVPALCQVACLCLRHLLPVHSPGQSAALLPTVTQLYMQMVLLALSSHGCLPARSLLRLSKVALRGLDTGKVIFSAEDISPPVLAFGTAHGLLTSFCVRRGPEHQGTGFAFAHLSLQEFFAALMLVASPEVDRGELVHWVTLPSPWVRRTKAKPDFLGHQSTFLAGLASCACRPFLSRLAQRDEAWVGDRQAAITQALRKLATPRLTGPKLVELCHCVGETQELGLARFTAQNLPCQLSFHNFPLTYANLAALANILGHRDTTIHLNFEGCPLEPHCPEALVGCGQVEKLSFKSRKCGDAFAEALSRSLPTMGSLQMLGLAGSRITSQGISHLVQALPLCPQLEEISLQNNQLKDQEVLNIVEILPCLSRLRKLNLSHNNVSVSTLLCLAKVAVTCPTVRVLQARQAELIFLLSPPTETATSLQRAPDLQGNAIPSTEALTRRLTLRFQKCELQAHDAEVLAALLREGPHLEEVDLSGNQLEDEGCRLMAEAAAQLHISRKLDLSDNRLTTAGLLCVLSVAGLGRSLAELHISLRHKTVVLVYAQEPEQLEETQERAAFLDSLVPQTPSELPQSPRTIRLTHCGLRAKHVGQLCKALGGSGHLGRLCHLDLSGNALGDQGATLLAQLLPGLGALQSLNLGENGFSLDAVFSLAQSFSTLEWLLHLDISLKSQCVLLIGDRRGRDVLADGSLPEFPTGAQFFGFGQRCVPRSFRLQECQLEPQGLRRLFETLEKCPGPLEVELSCEVLSDPSLETLLHCSSGLPQLSLLQLSHTRLSPRSPFLLADLFSLCPRVQKLELRCLQHVSLHFRSSEEQLGVCCGFTGCGLGQEHVEPLCWLLSKCDDLSQLDLSANQLGDEGLRCLLEFLPQVPISGWLVLNQNSISQEGALRLVEALPSCPCAREASANLGSEQSLRMRFSRQEEAGKTVRLSECSFRPEHVPRLAAGLSQAPQLTELTLTRCCLGLEQLTVLLSLVRRPAGLLSLRVEEPWVGTAQELALLEVSAQASGTVTQISVSKTQQQLCVQLEFPRQEENAEAVALRLTHPSLLVGPLTETCTRLRQLRLSQVDLSDASSLLLQSLLLSLSELREFRLTSSRVSTEGLAHLASGLSHCHHLEELDLSNNQFSEQDARALMGALEGKRRLRRLDLSHLPLGCSTLAKLTRELSHAVLLQSLSLSTNGIGDVGCFHLSEALRSATSLEELGLSYNQIGDTGAQYLAAILPGLPALRKIDLSWNSIGPAGGMPLAKSLTHCRRLEDLMLGWNALEDSTALELAQGLPAHLKVLHLPSSQLGPEGALGLGEALDGHPRVEDISLAENRLAGGVPLFSKGLPLLRKMDLISCEINNQTAKPLTTSLMLCPALEEILLSWNLLGDEAAAALARILPQMGRLKKVDLEKNQITACGAWLLAEGLAQGPGIQVIRLWNNPIAPDVAQRLQSQEPRLDFAFFEDGP
ncbi:protein NLRC5 isoform X2 [Dasypus novemcinctus]|uniref:protein NLRC5 isoform X2 n=1 Tax=Dasypus novemcinctus TaxID=9361 RepID=UPI00265F964B|nr:protein NLRC5 isoform X2 [Dasypus novemcinctus]XP_058135967.1 protein NLRC5 isoform X2 [Dasypus novemcinctus]XP_058135968.1 protein NLRC5 isoform X2 [Dasypus novemcinctus]XP_058135969.1 protein NLRC5 isoform X2 [Dasypus novemcinctus]